MTIARILSSPPSRSYKLAFAISIYSKGRPGPINALMITPKPLCAFKLRTAASSEPGLSSVAQAADGRWGTQG